MLWRFFFAAVIVVGASAATTAVAGLLQFKQLALDLGQSPALKNSGVVLPSPSAPQTLLLIGSDHRIGGSYRDANTDTMLLVRLNAASSTINVLSIPRDLEVQIPGYGTGKLNAAYSVGGGPRLLIKTIREDVFPALKVNHVLDVNFSAFSDLVDAIGCVYGAVDDRYYNLSGPPPDNYSSIDIQPGYQKLCGDNQSVHGALPFVRFRHTDSDLVRNARQQDFIRWAKDQHSTTQLLDNRDRLVSIFGHHAQTDPGLHSTDGLIELFNLVLDLSGHTIKSIPFPAILNNCPAAAAGQPQPPCYVNANTTAEQRVFKQFMTPTKATPATPKPPSPGRAKPPKANAENATPAGLTADPSDGLAQAAHLRRVAMLIYIPKLVVAGSSYCSSTSGNCNDPNEPASEYDTSYPRGYTIHDRQGVPHAAYYLTLQINSLAGNPLQGQYYGVQGTTWLHPPLLANPTQTKAVDGRELELFSAGSKLTTVAWRTPTAVYWIQNTLTASIPNRQMVQIAASLISARG